ncbi:hypothetical protein ACXYFN_02050 [Mycoplasma sp. 48589B]
MQQHKIGTVVFDKSNKYILVTVYERKTILWYTITFKIKKPCFTTKIRPLLKNHIFNI